MELNLELHERIIDIKEKRITEIVIYQLKEIKEHYDENLGLILKQFPVSDQLLKEGYRDAAETIWRTQIVLLSSAFDFFMHEIVWYGLDKIYDENWVKTEQYQNLSVKFRILPKIIENLESKKWFWDYITEKYKTQTLMSFQDVRDHLNLIGVSISNIADRAFYQKGCTISTKTQMQKALDELYNRRNQIAHQSDRSERDAKQNDISKTQVEKYIKNINKIVIAIIDEIKTL